MKTDFSFQPAYSLVLRSLRFYGRVIGSPYFDRHDLICQRLALLELLAEAEEW